MAAGLAASLLATAGAAGYAEPSVPPQTAAPASPGIAAYGDYWVQIVTGDRANAGTDGDVCVTMVGNWDSGCWGWLDSPFDDFERGSISTFGPLKDPGLGVITEIWVYFVPRGSYPAWFLDGIWVYHDNPYQYQFFRYCRWLTREGWVRLLPGHYVC